MAHSSDLPEQPVDVASFKTSKVVRESDYMDYRTIDGTKWRCWRTVEKSPTGLNYGFKHAPDGDENRAHSDSIINYYTWGNGKWTARWTGDKGGLFRHTPYAGGTSHDDTVLNYVGWQDPPHVELWQARFDLRRNIFIHERFLPK